MGVAAPEPLPSDFRVAVIGAGVAGLACAGALKARGARVIVFEASRRPGGRATTEPTPQGSFDPGAQYFTARNAAFQAVVEEWRRSGLAERWTARVVALDGASTSDKTASAQRYVVPQGMQSLCRRLGADVELHHEVRIGQIARRSATWHLLDATGGSPVLAGFDAVVVAVPNAAPLLQPAPRLAQRAQSVVWQPCWAALLALTEKSGFDFGGAFVNDHAALAWVTREDSKSTAGTASSERWVLHAHPRWSALHLHQGADAAAEELAEAFAQRFNFGFRPAFLTAHLWIHAAPANPLDERYLWDADLRIGAVGDWCGGPRIEGAFLSGLALGESMS